MDPASPLSLYSPECVEGLFCELRVYGVLWEVGREPVLPLPGGGWHRIMDPSHPKTSGDNTQEEAGSVYNERGG